MLAVKKLYNIIVAKYKSLLYVNQSKIVSYINKEYYKVISDKTIQLLKYYAICNKKTFSKSKGLLVNIQLYYLFEHIQINLINIKSDPD